MQGEVKYLYKMRRRAGSAPHPLPRSADGAVGGGGGGGWRVVSCLGNLEQGKGGSWACEFGGSHSRVDLACLYGKTFWRVCLAGQFGGSSGLIYSIDLRVRKTGC